MGPGRRPDHAPEGFYTVSEAARLLGITPAAVRGRIDRGTLPTKEGEHLTEGLETRHYIPKSVVDKEVAEKNLPANRGQIDERTSAVVSKLDTMTTAAKRERAAILAAIETQDEHTAGRLDRVLANQEAMREGLEAAIEVMRQAAYREKVYQDKVISMIDREAERQERRSLWRRLFGS
jgi:predicted transcriptional regulator